MKILLLYTELADYTLACLKALKNATDTSEITVIHYPINPEAPFDFDFRQTGIFISVSTFSTYRQIKDYVDAFQPDKIVVSGWANKWYLRICIACRTKTTCILSMDNHWSGTLKQKFFTLLFRSLLIHVFKRIWVPGNPQVSYAKKLGFKDKDIIKGFYSCNTDFYLQIGKTALLAKQQNFPRKLICVARYISAKNYTTLWEAFIQWKSKTNNDWELWCAGTGEQFEQRIQHPAIRHLGFVQKDTWQDIIVQTGVFILPSSFEPWGVAVHEFAAAGYPLILSSEVGAASAFLEKRNGWRFSPYDKQKLMDIFNELDSLPASALCAMGYQSMAMANKITPATWASSLLES